MPVTDSYYNEPFGAHLLSTQTASFVSNMVFTFTLNGPNYAGLLFDIVNFDPVAASAHFELRASADGGASFIATNWAQQMEVLDAFGGSYFSSIQSTYVGSILPLLNHRAGRKVNGRIMFTSRAGGGFQQFRWHMTGFNHTYGVSRAFGSGFAHSGSVNAISLGFYASNVNSGTARMYGLRP